MPAFVLIRGGSCRGRVWAEAVAALEADRHPVHGDHRVRRPPGRAAQCVPDGAVAAEGATGRRNARLGWVGAAAANVVRAGKSGLVSPGEEY
jgi:hypothetical protein